MTERSRLLSSRLSRKCADMQAICDRAQAVQEWTKAGGLLTSVGSNQKRNSSQPQSESPHDSYRVTQPRTSAEQSKNTTIARGTADYLLRLSEKSDEQNSDLLMLSETEQKPEVRIPSLQKYKEPRVLQPGEHLLADRSIDGCISELENWVQNKKLTKLKQKYTQQDNALFEIQEND